MWRNRRPPGFNNCLLLLPPLQKHHHHHQPSGLPYYNSGTNAFTALSTGVSVIRQACWANTLFVVMVSQVCDLIDDVRELSSPALICLHIEARAVLVSFQQQVKMTSWWNQLQNFFMCVYIYTYIYRVLAWNSRWHIPIGLTQSDQMTSLSHGTSDWFSPVLVANELSAQHSNIWLVLVVAVRSMLQKPSTFPSSTCIDLLRGDSCMI